MTPPTRSEKIFFLMLDASLKYEVALNNHYRHVQLASVYYRDFCNKRPDPSFLRSAYFSNRVFRCHKELALLQELAIYTDSTIDIYWRSALDRLNQINNMLIQIFKDELEGMADDDLPYLSGKKNLNELECATDDLALCKQLAPAYEFQQPSDAKYWASMSLHYVPVLNDVHEAHQAACQYIRNNADARRNRNRRIADRLFQVGTAAVQVGAAFLAA